MEIRIKSGDGVRCEYTGQESQVLVRLVAETESRMTNDSEHRANDRDSGWMGRKALESALKILDSMEGRSQTVTSGFIAVQSPPMPMVDVPHGYAPAAPVGVDSAQQIAQFEQDLVELVNNPPQSRDGGKPGLSEVHVRDLIFRYRNTFKNPMDSMGPALDAYLQMSRERLSVIMKMKQ